MKIQYKIYGHPSRIDMIRNLKNELQLDYSEVYLDDRKNIGNSLYVMKMAMLSKIDDDTTHILAIPDDMIVCNDFISITQRMVETHPDKIISLFPLGNEKVIGDGISIDYDKPYMNVYTLYGNGIIMPVEYIKPCFDTIKNKFNDNAPDDSAIQYWAGANNVECITMFPSTVQHIGDKSIIDSRLPIRRTKYFMKDMPKEINWEQKTILDKPIDKNILYIYNKYNK